MEQKLCLNCGKPIKNKFNKKFCSRKCKERFMKGKLPCIYLD
ncbi:MAG: DUF2116 family Zn-ribbon domain-containing protein [Caldisericum exile]